jgi:large subunit ribosomal protein L7/L12
MAETPAKEFSPEITELADKLVSITVKEAQSLVDCLREVHGIEPAGGGVVMAGVGSGAEAGAEAAEEQTSFDVVLEAFGDKKIQVIKVVRSLTSLGLKEAKDLVESCPKPVKEGVSKEDGEKIKAEIEAAGGAVSIK